MLSPRLFATFSVIFALFSSVTHAENSPGNTGAVYAPLGVDACTECHQDYADQINHQLVVKDGDAHAAFMAQDCESCHGPGQKHIELISEGEAYNGEMISYSGDLASSAADQNAMCLDCHQGGQHMNWVASIHESEDLACTSCHTVHRPDMVQERTTQSETCFTCHQQIRAKTLRASSHPIREGKVVCSDCHNPHGDNGPSDLKQFTINENCYSCHAEKRGPFLWEHFPVTEDCTNCHDVHGSNHMALLNKPGPQLCQQCHQDIRNDGRRHVRRLLDDADPDPARARMVVGSNCMNCHSQVHGSNHPSGVNLQR